MTIPSSASRLLCLLSLMGMEAVQGQPLRLQEAEKRTRERHPLSRQTALVERSAAIGRDNLSKQYLPQVSAGAQASYQSEVTRLSIPNAPFQVDPLSRDQYRVNLDVSQTFYDGGVVRRQREMTVVQARMETAKVETELHRARERVHRLFFGILLQDALMEQTRLMEQDIANGIRKVQAQVDGGIAFRSSLSAMQAEEIRAGQRMTELRNTRRGLLDALSVLMDTTFGADVRLAAPDFPDESVPVGMEANRPELKVFEAQAALGEMQRGMVDARRAPRASLFLQGGYGRPGLNMLKNQFDWYGLGGVRLVWPISNLYTARNDRELAQIQTRTAGLQRDAFVLGLRVQVEQQEAEVRKARELILQDAQIIALRKSVKEAALAQLEAGVTTASDYLREVFAEDQARQSLRLHEIQLAQALAAGRLLAGLAD